MGGVTGENMLSRAYRAAEFPGANMFANAHSLARMYAAMVSDVDGIRLLQPDTVAAMTVAQTDRTRMHGVPPELVPATKNLFNMSLGFWRSSRGTHAPKPVRAGGDRAPATLINRAGQV